jgi:hypothetical protein
MTNPAEMGCVLTVLHGFAVVVSIFFRHGFILTGFVFNVLLLGIMITQVYLYYTRYARYAWIQTRYIIDLIQDDEGTQYGLNSS